MNAATIDPLRLPSLGFWQRRNLPHCSAIYFVLLDDDVLYVGQAKDLCQRWKAHHLLRHLSEMDKPTRIAWSECDTARLTKLEIELINQYAPRLNGKHRSRRTVTIDIELPESSYNQAKLRCVAEKTTINQVCGELLYLWANKQAFTNLLTKEGNAWKIGLCSKIEEERLTQLFRGEAEPSLEEIAEIQEILSLSDIQIERLAEGTYQRIES